MNTTQHKETRKGTETRRRRTRDSGEVLGRRLAVIKSKLDFNNFAYRWITDEGVRMHAMTKEDDWDVVMNDGVKDDSTDLGNAVSVVVGTAANGSPLVGYLCRKPKQYFDEDQAAKSKDLDAQLARLRSGQDRAGGSQSDYIPSTGINLS